MGWSFSFAFQHYGDEWRNRRRLFHHHFSPQVIGKYRHRITREVVRALNRFLDHPHDYLENLRLHVVRALLDGRILTRYV